MFSLGADPEMDLTNTERQTKQLKKELTRAAVETAVAQTAASLAVDVGVAIALQGATVAAAMAAGSCVPIIGWAAAAVIAIGTLISSNVSKRHIKKILDDTKQKIQIYGDKTQDAVRAEENRIADAEFPAAEKLAQSGEPLGGLEGWLSKKKITHAVAVLQTKSVGIVGKAILRTGRFGAHLVGDKKGEARARKYEQNWDANTKRVQEMFERKLQNPYTMIAHDLDTIGRTVGGTQAEHVVKKKAAQLLAAAMKDMDLFRDKMLANFQTEDYRHAVRTNLARGMRGDPQYAAQVTELQANKKMLDATFASPVMAEQVVAASTVNPPPSAAGLVGTAAAIGAFLFLRP